MALCRRLFSQTSSQNVAERQEVFLRKVWLNRDWTGIALVLNSRRCAMMDRRGFIKLVSAAMLLVLHVASRGPILCASALQSVTGYGSARYGIGIYGVTSDRYPFYIPFVGK
jgi:hypothetical protein